MQLQLQLHCITQHYATLNTLHSTTAATTTTLHHTTLHYNYNYTTLDIDYNTLDYQYTIPCYSTQHYSTLHYTNYTTPQLQLQLQLHYTNYTTLQLQLKTTTPLITLQLQPHLQLQLHYTTLHPAVVVRWPLQPLQPRQKTQLQPPFGPSVDSLCHPWFTTTNFSYRFTIFETSATALHGTTGISMSCLLPKKCWPVGCPHPNLPSVGIEHKHIKTKSARGKKVQYPALQ